MFNFHNLMVPESETHLFTVINISQANSVLLRVRQCQCNNVQQLTNQFQ